VLLYGARVLVLHAAFYLFELHLNAKDTNNFTVTPYVLSSADRLESDQAAHTAHWPSLRVKLISYNACSAKLDFC
jgi:hypothetical protein